MKDEEKKNEYPVPSGGTVRTSYILFLIVMIFMLVFCALFLSSASAEANYMVGGGVIKGSGEMSSIAIGSANSGGAYAPVSEGPENVVAGVGAQASVGRAAVLGAFSKGGEGSVAVGYYADAKQPYTVAVGDASSSTVSGGVAVGWGAVADRRTSLESGGARVYSPSGATVEERNAVNATVRGGMGVVSIGDGSSSRQISNVAAGIMDGDAANVAQLKALENSMSRSVEAAKKENGGKIKALDDMAVKYDGKDKTSVTFGTRGKPVQLANVAEGYSYYDAANYGQLNRLENVLNYKIETVAKQQAADDRLNVKYDGKDKNSVTLTSAQEGEAVRLTNVADGKIVQYGRDAVNGGQLWTLGSSVAGALGGSFSVGAGGGVTGSFTVDGKEAASVQEAIDQTVDLAKNAKKSEWKLRVNGKETAVRDGDVIAVDEGKNISIAPDANTGVYKVGVVDNPEFASVKAGNVLIGGNGIDMGGTRMTGLADGRVYQGSSDAVTGSQLWDAYRRMDKIDERAKMIGAHAAALSALHPVPYNPYEPTTLSAGFGAYRGEYSAAVGVFHYVRENLLVNTGLALNTGGDLMARAGISVAVGRGGQRRASLVRDMTDVQRELAAMRQTISQLKKENAQNKETIRELQKASHTK